MSTRYPTTGTTVPIYVPCDPLPQVIKPDESYFRIKLHSAQAAFRGSIWDKVRQLIIISQVALGEEPMRAIQRSRSVERGRAEQLGLAPNLINLVPATMTQVSVSIEFILDTQNRLTLLGSLINDNTFMAAISLAPGVAAVARAISTLSQKILQTFLTPEDRQPILQFHGDFDIATEELRDGYYVILGTRDEASPLPDPGTKFEVQNGMLLANGVEVTQLSYIVLEVNSIRARTRGLNEGSGWDSKLREAEARAQLSVYDPDPQVKQQAWKECMNAIKEAQLLLLADSNYLHREAKDITLTVFAACREQIFGEQGSRSFSTVGEALGDMGPDLAFLGVSSDENLDARLDRYASQVVEARRNIREKKIV